MNIENAIAYFGIHEGRVPHMYLDSVGLVTVGIGRMLASTQDAQTLPFVVRGAGAPASPEEIAAEWHGMKKHPKNHVASFYEKFTSLVLPDAAIDTELVKNIDHFSAALRQRFPGFNLYPDPAQLGILDMAFSMGAHGLVAGYPKFCAAVDAQDWKLCAAESSRQGVSPQRNDDCAALFVGSNA